MNITTSLLGFMATASSEKMEGVRDRLQAAVRAMDDEVQNDPLAFLYADIYAAIETLDINIGGAIKEEKLIEENKKLERIHGK